MKYLFIPVQNPILRTRAAEISPQTILEPETQQIMKHMLEIGYGKQKDKKRPVLVGLAAPQIGISKRIIVVDTKADGKGESGGLEVFINPEIIYSSQTQTEWYEGCWSIPGICGVLKRPESITIKAYSDTGKVIAQTYRGYLARIFQHEIDHLNGILFPNHIANQKHLHLVKENEFVEYRNNEKWRTWSRTYSLEEWKQLCKVQP